MPLSSSGPEDLPTRRPMPLTESDGAKAGPEMSTKPISRPGGGRSLIQRESASIDTRVSPVAMSTRPATPSVSFTIGLSRRMPMRNAAADIETRSGFRDVAAGDE